MVRRYYPLAVAAWALLPVATPAAAAPRTYIVVIENMRFGPVPQLVHKGDIIVWDNRDIFQHSATDNGVFDIDIPAGKKVAIRMKASGTFPFFCKYHPGMKAVLKVAP
jgi:plastocyanin